VYNIIDCKNFTSKLTHILFYLNKRCDFWQINLREGSNMKDSVIVAIDGEHYPPVVKEALHELKQTRSVMAAIFVGGTEKIGSLHDLENYFGIPIFFPKNLQAIETMLPAILSQYPADTVFDLSDDPVIDSKSRMKLATSILFHGLSYEGADYSFRPMKFPILIKKPTMSVIGSGKRVGKTAIAGYIARTLKAVGINPCILTMGRGGPEDPELVDGASLRITPEYLLQIAEQGRHAASDFWEDALTSRVWTIGCRRCGGGMAGMPYTENVTQGAQLANKLPVDFTILEGSGPTIPPVAADVFVLVIGANRPTYLALDYLGPYRIKLAQIVVLTNCENPFADSDKVDSLVRAVNEINPSAEVFQTIFRPLPLEQIQDELVFYCTTASSAVIPKICSFIENTYQCEVVGYSSNLSNRPLLNDDLNTAKGDYSVLLTELKAAAVDVATKTALNEGTRVVYCDNIPTPLNTSSEIFSQSLVRLAKELTDLYSKSLEEGRSE